MYKLLNHKALPINHRKELMKISNVSFGLGGYQNLCFGLFLDFEQKGGLGASNFISGGWDFQSIERNTNAEWNEKDRERQMLKLCKSISLILKDANVSSIDKLKGMPVEIIVSNNSIQSWRILEEVI
jgi:hypothetical protein